MSNKTKRFSMQGLFSKATSPQKEKSGPASNSRSASHQIKGNKGKRLTVYLPDENIDVYTASRVDERKTVRSSLIQPKKTETLSSLPKVPPSEEVKQISPKKSRSPDNINNISPIRSPIYSNQRQVSAESTSSSYYPDISRNITVSSSIYPQSINVDKDTKTQRTPNNLQLLRKQSSKDPSLLRKRKPPPKPLIVNTDANNVIKEVDDVSKSPVSLDSPKNPSEEIITRIDTELRNFTNPSTDAVVSTVESHYSPLHLRPIDNIVDSPLKFSPIGIETVDAPVITVPSSPSEKKPFPIYKSKENYKEEIAEIETNTPKVSETINLDSPEFKVSKNFSDQGKATTLSHKHTRTISSLEDITNVIDSFQLSHTILPEEHEHDEETITTDDDFTTSYGGEQGLNLNLDLNKSQISEHEENELKNSGLYLKVSDLPELEEGQTIDDYVANLEKEIALKRIPLSSPVTSSPLMASSSNQSLHVIKPTSIANNISQNSSASDVFYEANEYPRPINSKKLAYDDFMGVEDDEEDEEASIGEGDDALLEDVPPPYSSTPASPQDPDFGHSKVGGSDQFNDMEEESNNYDDDDDNDIDWQGYERNHTSTPVNRDGAGRNLDLDDEIVNNIGPGVPAVDSLEDLYPDDISEDSIEEQSSIEDDEIRHRVQDSSKRRSNEEEEEDEDDDDGLLEFTPKSPISGNFNMFENIHADNNSWEEKTPNSYRNSLGSLDDFNESPDGVEDFQNKSHLMVINGTPDSASVPNGKFSDEGPLEAPILPTLPSQYSLERGISDRTITQDNDEGGLSNVGISVPDFPIYDRREEPSVSPIQHSTVITPVAPLLKNPLMGLRRPPPDFPNGGRRARGLSTTTTNPELFSNGNNDIINVVDKQRQGKGQRSKYVDNLRLNGKTVSNGKLNPSILPISLRTANNTNSKQSSTSTLLFGGKKHKTRVLASEMDDNELPDATQLHSGKTKVPTHPDADVIAANEEFKKMTELTQVGANISRRRDSIASVVPRVQQMRLYIVNPDKD